MARLKLSPSKIETYRKYLVEEYAGTITAEKVIASIKGEEQWSKQATFGSAAHLVMQFGAEKYLDKDEKSKTFGKYVIKDHDMPEAVILTYSEIELFDKFHVDHPNMVWESKAVLVLNVDGHEVTINMRIDGMEGLTIHENKTGKNDLDFDFFEASFQWKCYLLATLANKVEYNVFSYYEPNTRREEYEVFHDFMVLYPYPTMESDLKEGIRQLIEFCRVHDLMSYLINKS